MDPGLRVMDITKAVSLRLRIIKLRSQYNLKMQAFERTKNMASSKEYLQFILEQLSDLEEINYRAMMGEYIIYYRGRIVGGIYDDRLLVKPTKSAVSYMATATYELPYEGAKEMLLVEDVDSKEYLTGLFNAMYDELPVHKAHK